MLKTLLRPFFSTILIGINLDAKVCSLKIVIMKNKTIKNTLMKDFKIVDKELPMEAAKLIKSYKRKYPFTYLSAMSKTYNQGLAQCAKKSDLIKFGINTKTARVVEMPNQWLFYIEQLAIDENRVKFIRALGLDYLFSPFVLVYENIKKTLDSDLKLYVLQERANITLFIADEKGVYFGGFFMIGGELESSDEDGSMVEVHSLREMSELDSILGSLDELNEIGELEDLDEELIRKEFAPEELDNKKQQEAEMSRLEGLKDLARASNTSEIIKNSISEFYANPIYNARFVESVVILDSYGMNEQAIAHIRNALLLDIEVRPIHIPDALIELAKIELYSNKG